MASRSPSYTRSSTAGASSARAAPALSRGPWVPLPLRRRPGRPSTVRGGRVAGHGRPAVHHGGPGPALQEPRLRPPPARVLRHLRRRAHPLRVQGDGPSLRHLLDHEPVLLHGVPAIAVDMGIVPLKEAEQLRNGYLTTRSWTGCRPGMPSDICLRNFPSFIRTADPDDAILRIILGAMACHRTTPSAIIFHTFDEIDREAMSTILPPTYAVRPLPLLLGQVSGGVADTLEPDLSRVNRVCLEWLEGKRANSVLYVSFGSITTLTSRAASWWSSRGVWLAVSNKDFLWVIRDDQVNDSQDDSDGPAAAVLPPEFLEETKARSHVTRWCPQEAVLRHEATGAFLTRCGWNSVLESLGAWCRCCAGPSVSTSARTQGTFAPSDASVWRSAAMSRGARWRRPSRR